MMACDVYEANVFESKIAITIEITSRDSQIANHNGSRMQRV